MDRKESVERRLSISRRVDRTSADLLVPANLLPFAMRSRKRFGHWRDLIAYLVCRYRSRLLRLSERQANLCFLYQSEGLNLQRVSYLPYLDTRVELRIFSFAARVSMCALVVLMLQWEKEAESQQSDIFGVTIHVQTTWSLRGDWLNVVAGFRLISPRPPPMHKR